MVHQLQVVWGPATRLKFGFTMNVFSSQSFWCIPKTVTSSTGDKDKNLTARSFVMGGSGDMVLRDPLERSAWEETTLEGGEEATEAAGQSPPSSVLICLPPSSSPSFPYSVSSMRIHSCTQTTGERAFAYVCGTGRGVVCV